VEFWHVAIVQDRELDCQGLPGWQASFRTDALFFAAAVSALVGSRK
jgi:hypothetical protein